MPTTDVRGAASARAERGWLVHVLGRWAVAFAIIVALLVAVDGLVALAYSRVEHLDVSPPGSGAGGTTYLFVGSDSRRGLDPDATRAFGTERDSPGDHADLMLLLRVPDDGGRATVTSIPRDLAVLDDREHLARLGLVLQDGPQHLTRTLCRRLGVGIDRLVIARFEGFENIVDAMGGVDLTLTGGFRDGPSGIKVPAGDVHLDGRGALSFVRARHGEIHLDIGWVPEPESALRRGVRARMVLRAIADQMPTATDPIHFARTMWATTGAVAVDRDATFRDVRGVPGALATIAHADEVDLPVRYQDGPVPVALLDDGALDALAPFQDRTGDSGCRGPAAVS